MQGMYLFIMFVIPSEPHDRPLWHRIDVPLTNEECVAISNQLMKGIGDKGNLYTWDRYAAVACGTNEGVK